MLDREEIARFGPPGYTLAQKEKDYVQHWILNFVSRTGFRGVFKGGTCLQKAYGLPRYSEDLDFTATAKKSLDIEALKRFLLSAGLEVVHSRYKETEISENYRIKLRGPLYNKSLLSICSVRIDISTRESLIYRQMIKNINPPYPDIMPYTINTMDPREIAAEKVRAILTRESARDLYDLYFLIRSGNIPERGDVERKLGYYSKSLDLHEFESAIDSQEKIWDKEIESLTRQPIGYGQAREQIIKMIKKSKW